MADLKEDLVQERATQYFAALDLITQFRDACHKAMPNDSQARERAQIGIKVDEAVMWLRLGFERCKVKEEPKSYGTLPVERG